MIGSADRERDLELRHEEDEDEGRLVISRRKVLVFALFAVLAVVALYYLVPQLAGLTLTEGVRLAAPKVAPAFRAVSEGVARLEARAR